MFSNFSPVDAALQKSNSIPLLPVPASKGHQRKLRTEDQWTRFLCIVGLALSWAVAVFCIVFGGLNVRGYNNVQTILNSDFEKDYLRDIFILLQTIVLTLSHEALGYIHTVSLRWALHRDGKLAFNSNLRLWQNASTARPNAWYGNLIMTIGQVATFGSSAMTVFSESDSGEYWLTFLGPAWLTLGIGIMMESAVASWAMCSWPEWPTWSSDPMDVAAACLRHKDNLLVYRPGRCLHGVDQINHPAMSMYPASRQESAYQSHKDVKRVTRIIWTVPGLCLAWAAGVLIATVVKEPGTLGEADYWSPLGSDGYDVFIPSCCSHLDSSGYYIITAGDYIWFFVVVCLLQSVVAFATYCAELNVNLSRDEYAWREASSKKGYRKQKNALHGFLTSWQSWIMLVLKVAIQWFFGLTFATVAELGLVLYGPQTLYLMCIMFLLAVFATYLVLQRPKGPQPTTYGHLQALIDLIDEWPEENEMMHWGDKGKYSGPPLGQNMERVRHAGTSARPLKPLDITAEYA